MAGEPCCPELGAQTMAEGGSEPGAVIKSGVQTGAGAGAQAQL